MDLYNLPGDDGKTWRYTKALEWVSNFPNEIVPSAKLYFEKKNWTDDDKVWFILLYSASYSYPSSLIMHSMLDYKTLTPTEFDKFWLENKPKLIFQSDRFKIGKMYDPATGESQFKTIVFQFLERSERQPAQYLKQFVFDDKTKTYEAMYKEIIKNWKYYGRFGTVLFMYNYMQMMNTPMDYTEFEWDTGKTVTAALYNILYLDEEANTADSSKRPTLSKETLTYFNAMIVKMANELRVITNNPNYGIMNVTSDLCSYRKLFKKVRYNGFYVDRQLEEITTLRNNYQGNAGVNDILDFLMDARLKTLDHRFLGEVGGWNGIRKERFDHFLKTGDLS